jgi:hypothetical protein
MCPEHGHYYADPEAAALIRRATSGRVGASAARRLLDEAARIRRRCPSCRTQRPAPLEWIATLRQRININ